MNIKKITEEILMLEYIKKLSGVDVKKYPDINKAFINYISNRLFDSGGKKVPYLSLQQNEREKVWNEFWESVSDSKSNERLIEETIRRMKQPVQPTKQQPVTAV